MDEIKKKQKYVPGAGLEPARPQWSQDFKSCVSTNSTTRAAYYAIIVESERRDLNPRPQPWQGCALPAELLSLINILMNGVQI